MERMTWDEIRQRQDLRGRWIVLFDCKYDEVTGKALEGSVVDSDLDLAKLCRRVNSEHRRNCAIVFCCGDEAA